MRYDVDVTWKITFFNDRLEEEVLTFPPGFLARYLRYAERMEIYGPDLGMPHTKALGGGLFELRIKAFEGLARVFYCTVVNHRIVMLHHFVKKTDRTPPRELAVARRRMKEIKDV